jgi:hypothetical protein
MKSNASMLARPYSDWIKSPYITQQYLDLPQSRAASISHPLRKIPGEFGRKVILATS